MATNSFGLDAAYFSDKLSLVLRDLSHFTPEELARALARMARTACEGVLGEAEFTVQAAPACAAQDGDAQLDAMRRSGLSIDGDNAYKRDLIDCIVGALMLGKQGVNPPPAGHWLEQFWQTARGEGEIQEQLAATPAAQEPVVRVIDETAAHNLGAIGAEPTEFERRLFEAWMRGHCWAISGEWNGRTYIAADEDGRRINQHAMMTRQLWAAWRDRAALTGYAASPATEQPTGTKSDKYRAELYDEVWQEARALGFGNVTEALSALARQQLDEKPDASAQLASIEAMCAMVEAREWADHVGVGEIGKRVESAISTLRNELQEAQRTAMAEQPDAVRVLHELPEDDIERRVASGHLRCTCPSGDGSLRWPCSAHPPSVSHT